MNYIQKSGLILLLAALVFFTSLMFLGQFKLTDTVLKDSVKEEHYPVLKNELAPMLDKQRAREAAE